MNITIEKFAHLCVCALALAWFLMIPPQAERSGMPLVGPDLKAPLSEWQPARQAKIGESAEFASKAACQDYRSGAIADAKDRLLVGAPPDVGEMPSERRLLGKIHLWACCPAF
jgi:hypothetical protein